MLRKITLLLFIISIGNYVSAQDSDNINDLFYVNVFISADKTVYVESDKTEFQNIEDKVSDIIRNKPFKLDQKVVYRIFADEKLKMRYLIDVDQKLLSAYNQDVKRERFLLNTVELNIDGENWFNSIDLKKLEKVN